MTNDIKITEFKVELPGATFLFEPFKDAQGKMIFYVSTYYLIGEKHYFFMAQNEEGKWFILSKLTVPADILAVEAILVDKLDAHTVYAG